MLQKTGSSPIFTKKKQCVTIDGVTSEYKPIEHGVPQGSVLGPLLFLIYINDLNKCIRHSTVRHFADDTNLLYYTDKSKTRNRNLVRHLNTDLKSLNHWLLANKISLNATKTELIFFRKKNTPIPNVKIKLNGVKLVGTNSVKYVGVIFDEYLEFKEHIDIMNAKLKNANNLIAISRHYTSRQLMIQIYYGQFHSHLTYGCQLWGQDTDKVKKTITQQKKAMRLITFSHYHAETTQIFKELGILKLSDIVTMNNILFTHDTMNNRSPTIFNNYFTLKLLTHRHQTINNPNTVYSTLKGFLELPKFNSKSGKNSIKSLCSLNWNSILRELSIKFPLKYRSDKNWLKNTKTYVLKKLLKEHFLSNY